jgi:hypothetical protein
MKSDINDANMLLLQSLNFFSVIFERVVEAYSHLSNKVTRRVCGPKRWDVEIQRITRDL